MSTPNQGPSRNPINRVTAWASRLNNRRRGTSMLKAAYAQARRDVKQMDPAVRERLGRANLTAAELQSLSVAHIQGEYGSSAQAAYSQRLDAIATGRVQEAGPSAPPTKNPIRWLANWDSRRRDRNQGTALLKAAYAQARRDVKQMDPAVREQIGQARITSAELQHLAQIKMSEVLRPELRQNAAPAQAQAQAGQAQGQAAQAQGQAQGQPATAPQAARPTVAQRIGQAAGTVSRWAQTAWSATTTAARQAAQAFTAARQNPEADPRTTEAWNSPGYTSRETQVATGRETQVAGQQPGSPEHQVPEQQAPEHVAAADQHVGKHPIVSPEATSEAVASEPATDQQVTGEPAAKQDVEVASDPHATDAANGAATKDVASKVERPVTLADMNNVRAAFSGVSAARIDPNAVKAAATQTNASTENNRGQQTTRETDHTTGR